MNDCELKRELLAYSLPPLTREDEKELFIRYKSGEYNLKEDIFRHNIRFVIFLLDRYYNDALRVSLTYEDLLQEGCIGLLEAIEKRTKYDSPFSSYAKIWIMAYIKRAVTNRDSTIHIGEEAMRLYYKYKGGVILNKNDKETALMVSQALTMGTLNVQVPTESNEEPGSELINFLPSDKQSIESLYEDKEIHDILVRLIEKFAIEYYPNNKTKRNNTRYVLKSYYGLDAESKKVEEIADNIGMKKSGVRGKLYAFQSFCSIQPVLQDYKNYAYK